MMEQSELTYEQKVANELVQLFSRLDRDSVMFDDQIGIENNRRGITFSKALRKYDTQTVDLWLEQPLTYAKELRKLSLFLLQTNTLYFRTVGYMAGMAQICPVAIPNSVHHSPDELKRTYFEVARLIEYYQLQHEMVKVLASLFAEGVFFGIECEGDQSVHIKKLNPDYCLITSTNNGRYCFHFNVQYFERDFINNEELLKSYSSIWSGFAIGYEEYKRDSMKNWIAIPPEIGVCFKISEGTEHSAPPFVSVFSDLCHIADYKNLNKISTEQGNYQLIGLEMEHNPKSDKPNDFTTSTDVALSFYNMISNSLPPGVGAFLTPMSAKPIKFDKRTGDANQVANATSALYDSLGISPIVFSGATNAGGLKYSVRTDESMVFGIYRQIERWLNGKLLSLGYDYHVKLLDLTIYNRNDLQAELLKLAQMSVPVKSHLAASAGLSPLDMLNTSVLESVILEIDEKWKPLTSSHTQKASTDEAGRQAKDETELTEAGEATRDHDSNANRESVL